MKNIYLTGNLIFVKVEFKHSFVDNQPTKYMIGSVSGNLFGGEGTITYDEIVRHYPNVKGIDDFVGISAVWAK